MRAVGLQLLLTAAAVAVTVSLLAVRGLPPSESLEDALYRDVSPGRVTQVLRHIRWGADSAQVIEVAVFQGQADLVAALLDFGIDPNEPAWGLPLLSAAVSQAHADDENVSLLHGPFLARRLEVARLLLDHGAEIDGRDHDGNTALHWAAEWGPPQMVTFLLDNGADVTVRNNAGQTPLHWGVHNWDYDPQEAVIVRLLLDAGADADAGDDQGRTPLQLTGQGRSAAIELLRRHGAGE